VGARTIGDYPKSLAEFQRRFATEEACVRYVAETRWPGGVRCAWCGSANAGLLTTRRVWQCRDCRRQTSLTAGTILERTHLALPTWFAAAYLMTSVKPGISALQLSRQLGISLKTAWLLLHKLRRAMVDPARGILTGEVEVDETWIGGRQAGLKGGRQRRGRKALLVALAVERRRKLPRADGRPHAQPFYLGRLRAEIVPDASQATLTAFLERNVERGSTIVSDAWQGYHALSASFVHQSINQSALQRAGFDPNAVPGVHRVIGNLKTWLLGTYHGVGADHLDHYLDEFIFRFNRRFAPMAGFATLLRLGSERPPTPRAEISPPLQPGATLRRRGRSTGLTSARFSHQIGESTSLEEAIAKLTEELPA
jgi:transposase-like protein